MHLSFIDNFAQYRFSIRRPALSAFNQFAELRIGLSVNDMQIDSSSCIVRLHIPDGDGTLRREISTRGTLNKKGRFNALPAEIEQQHDRFLHLYNSVRAVLENKCGRALLLMFGTLLGQHRDGDFIPWDDDFDVGYLSAETQPEAVKEEAKAIVLSLLAAGYDVVVGKRLRMPFWVRFGDGAPGEHLSLRPIWRQHGVIWSEIKARMNLSADDFSPVEARMRGVKIYKPKNTEAFLAEYYGESWRTPDPSYSNAVRATPSHVNRNLARSAFSMRDVMAMKQEAESWRTHGRTPGQLHCSNIDGLYPLEVYERIYGW